MSQPKAEGSKNRAARTAQDAATTSPKRQRGRGGDIHKVAARAGRRRRGRREPARVHAAATPIAPLLASAPRQFVQSGKPTEHAAGATGSERCQREQSSSSMRPRARVGFSRTKAPRNSSLTGTTSKQIWKAHGRGQARTVHYDLWLWWVCSAIKRGDRPTRIIREMEVFLCWSTLSDGKVRISG